MARYRRDLFPTAFRMTGNASDAEDLVQDAMTRAYAGLAHFTPGTNGRAWLFRIMSNTFINNCRRRGREPVHVLSARLDGERSDEPSPICDSLLPSIASAEDEVLDRFINSEACQVLAELPAPFRATVYLADVEGYSCNDVARLTGVPVGTVMSRLHRARAKLKRRLSTCVRSSGATESVAT